MFRTKLSRINLLMTVAICTVMASTSVPGCNSLGLSTASFDMSTMKFRAETPDKSGKDDEDADEGFEKTTVKVPMVGEYTTTVGLNMIVLQGVGLVTGLDGTGGDTPPSMYRTTLLDEMKRRSVKNPNHLLQSPQNALVVVRAYVPPLIRKGETFDVEIRLPENSEATSLAGGWLLETTLTDVAVVPGRGLMKGHVFAKAQGPILVSTADPRSETSTGVVKRGRILGGAVSMKDRDMVLMMRNEHRNARTAQRIATRIGQRFYGFNRHGIKESLATAKNDKRIELRIPDKYKDNYPRYLQVIRNIAFREKPVEQRVRVQKLEDELLNPATSELASLRLESVGNEAIPILKKGIASKSLEVRFHSAVALAYLGESDGIPVLAEAARKEPAFRVYALAAMAAIEDAESHIQLRGLMNERSAETRYGAFRALSTLDKNDPFIRGEAMGDKFMLHVLDTEGPPMIHMTRRKKAEVVIFGADQELETPLTARAGSRILVTAAAGSNKVTVSRFDVGKPDRERMVSRRAAEVIRTVVEFGGTYPDVAQLLSQFDRQKNVTGRIEIDTLPRAGRTYYRPDDASSGGQKKARVGSEFLVPNIFLQEEEPERKILGVESTPEKKKPGKPASSNGKSGKNTTNEDASKTDPTDFEPVVNDPDELLSVRSESSTDSDLDRESDVSSSSKEKRPAKKAIKSKNAERDPRDERGTRGGTGLATSKKRSEKAASKQGDSKKVAAVKDGVYSFDESDEDAADGGSREENTTSKGKPDETTANSKGSSWFTRLFGGGAPAGNSEPVLDEK